MQCRAAMSAVGDVAAQEPGAATQNGRRSCRNGPLCRMGAQNMGVWSPCQMGCRAPLGLEHDISFIAGLKDQAHGPWARGEEVQIELAQKPT